jgi:hypothetical protein
MVSRKSERVPNLALGRRTSAEREHGLLPEVWRQVGAPTDYQPWSLDDPGCVKTLTLL